MDLSAYRAGPVLLVLGVVAVASLAVGPFVYRSLLPETAEAPPAGCSFFAVIGLLLALLIGSALQRRRRRLQSRPPAADRRLRDAVLGPGDGRRPPGRP